METNEIFDSVLDKAFFRIEKSNRMADTDVEKTLQALKARDVIFAYTTNIRNRLQVPKLAHNSEMGFRAKCISRANTERTH